MIRQDVKTLKHPERKIDQFRRRIFLFLTLDMSIKTIAMWLFLWGSFFIATRMGGWLTNRVMIIIGLSGVFAAIIGCGIRAFFRLPESRALRAILDERGQCGGIFAAGEEYELGEWEARLPERIYVPIHWSCGKSWLVLTMSVLFCLAGGFVKPTRFLDSSLRKGVESQSRRLSDEIQLLKEADVLTEEQAKDLEEKLAKIEETSKKEEKAETWEAMDHLEEMLDKAVKESSESAVNGTEELTRIEALSEMLADGDIGQEALSEEASEMLAEMVKDAIDKGILPKLSEDMQNATAGKKLTSEQLKKLAGMAKLSKSDIELMMKKLSKAGMCKAECCSACWQAGLCDKDGLKSFLKKNCESGCLETGLNLFCGCPGRGGVNRGRGDAEMTWSEGTSEDNAYFKEELLDSEQPKTMDEGEIIAMNKGTPEVEKKREAIKRGGFSGVAKSGGEGTGQVILPKHRAAVRGYFKRK